MVIQNASSLDNETLLKAYRTLQTMEASEYYDYRELREIKATQTAIIASENNLHCLRHELARVRVLLEKRGFRLA